jgi:hypothetical protein
MGDLLLFYYLFYELCNAMHCNVFVIWNGWMLDDVVLVQCCTTPPSLLRLYLGALVVVVVSVVGRLLYLLARPTHRPIKMEEEEEHKAQAKGRMM